MAACAVASSSQPWEWQKQYDVDLMVPTGGWFQPLARFESNIGYYPDTTLIGTRSSEFVKHSGQSSLELDNPEWRQRNLTIYGWALQKAEKEAQENPMFARHAGGVPVDPFSLILGEVPYVIQRGIDIKQSNTWMTPATLAGQQSEKLAATIEHLVTAQEDALWNELVPQQKVAYDANNVVHWTVIQHQPAIARDVPTPLSLPTMVSARAWTQKQELGLRSISGRIGIGFWRTEMGTRHWYETLRTIASGIVAAKQLSSAIVLSGTAAGYTNLQRSMQHGFLPSFDYAHDWIAKFWALFQHPSCNYFGVFREDLLDRLRIQHADAGKYVLLTTPEAVIALSKGNKEGTSFAVSGPYGPDMLRQPVMTRQTLYDVIVYASYSFLMPHNYMFQPFALPFEVGEYITWFDNTPDGSKFDISSMNRRVFTRENWVQVTFKQAIENLCCWDSNGDLIEPDSTFNPVDHSPVWWKGDGRMLETTEGGSNEDAPIHFATYPFYRDKKSNTWKAVKGFPTNKTAALDLFNKRLHSNEKNPMIAGTAKSNMEGTDDDMTTFPFQIIGFQAFQRGFGHEALYMLPGKVAVALYKDGHAMVEDSFEQQVHQVRCEYSAGCAAIFMKNLVEARNVLITHTTTGYGVEPIRPAQPTAGYPDRLFNPNDLENGIIGDIIYVPVPSKYYYPIANVPRNVNLRGIVSGDLVHTYTANDDVCSNAYPGYAYCAWLYQLMQNKCGSNGIREYNDGFRTTDFPVNICCRHACYQEWDSAKKTYTRYREGNGYWGMVGTYSGAGSHRSGYTFLSNPDRGKHTIA